MPNHCENDLYISGPADQVAALLTLIGADQTPPKFDFNALLPYPAKFAERDAESRELGWQGFAEKYGQGAKDGYNDGGYEWCCENWGTKWPAYEVQWRDEGSCLTFQTAWSPPAPVIVELHKRFPLCTLHLESFESGAAFAAGFSLLPEEDWFGDDPWMPGMKSGVWHAEYNGHRGG